MDWKKLKTPTLGEDCLVIQSAMGFKRREIVKCVDEEKTRAPMFKSDKNRDYLNREKVLCVGQKVTRGPDMDKFCAPHKHIGEVTGFKHHSAAKDHHVDVKWPDKSSGHYRMTPDHQDLKPTGGSVEDGKVEEDKPECFGEYQFCDKACGVCPSDLPGRQCKCTHAECSQKTKCRTLTEQRGNPTKESKPKPIKEEVTMSRSARKRELIEKVIPNRKDALEDAMLSLTESEDELDRLEQHKTEHAENVALVMMAAKKTEEEAKAILLLVKKDINVQV